MNTNLRVTPKNEKLDYPDNNDDHDIQWFENYEKRSKINHLGSLTNRDILNYIEDIRQNCRLEMSSDEDYAETKRSSNCSVRFSGADVTSENQQRGSPVTSKRNKSTVFSVEKLKRPFGHGNTNVCSYCYTSQKSCLRGNPVTSAQENSRKTPKPFVVSPHRYLKSLNGDFCSNKYLKPSPRFYGWYSRTNRKTWPTVTETTSFEVVRDRSRDALFDSKIDRSRFTVRKPTKIRTSRALRRRKFNSSDGVDIRSNFTSNKQIEKDLRYRTYDQEVDRQTEKLNGERRRNVRNLLDKSAEQPCYILTKSQEERHKRPYICRSWNRNFRSNGSTISARLFESSPLSQRRTSRWKKAEVASLVNVSGSILKASINNSYEPPRETKYKSNANQQPRKPNTVVERGFWCCRKPGLLRKSRKLRRVIRTYGDKQQLGCCCENVKQNETSNCLKYCCRSNNANGPIQRNYQRERTTCRPVRTSNGTNYIEREKISRHMLSKSIESGVDDEVVSNFSLPLNKCLQDHYTKCDDLALNEFDPSDNDKGSDHSGKIELDDYEPNAALPREWTCRMCRSCKFTQERRKEVSDDLNSGEREAMKAPQRKILQGSVIRRCSSGGFSFGARTSGKFSPGDYSKLEYDSAESMCECKELFNESSATCLIGCCTCVKNKRAARSDIASRKIFNHCYSPSMCFHDGKDPVKKLESFCEKVKAVNKDDSHMPTRSSYCRSTKADVQRYPYRNRNKQSRFEVNTQTVRSIGKEWSTDSTCLTYQKPKYNRNNTSLERILIYPPRGEGGPPLILYKKSSNINCQVNGDVNSGFHYNVTYVQKFVSPTWMPDLSPRVIHLRKNDKCDCSTDYG